MIRIANHSDAPRLVEMARAFHAAATDGPALPFDAAMALHAAHAAIGAPDAAIFIAEKRGRAVGMLCAVVAGTPFGPGRLAQEFAFWIEPDARGGSAAMKLMRAYEAWAKERGATAAGLVDRDGSTARFYDRNGYKPAETHFWKAL